MLIFIDHTVELDSISSLESFKEDKESQSLRSAVT